MLKPLGLRERSQNCHLHKVIDRLSRREMSSIDAVQSRFESLESILASIGG